MQINRAGIVRIADKSLAVWEEPVVRLTGKAGDEWRRLFKRQVFARIVQTLNRIGWKVDQHIEHAKQYGRSFANSFRICSKGDLRAELKISGRSISLEFWQGVNTPTRPDHGGRYEKIEAMPYLLRLEMNRTRNRIARYLTAVFSGYIIEDVQTPLPLQLTAMEKINRNYAASWHFKGYWAEYLANGNVQPSNRKSADGTLLEHGQPVWLRDYHGRWMQGTAYYNINNMWWVVLGRYAYTNRGSHELHTTQPPDLRSKDNRKRAIHSLRELLRTAIDSAEFERAALYRDQLALRGFDCRVKSHA